MDKSFQEKNITDYKHSPAKRLATKIKRKRDTLTKPIESSSNIVTEVAIKYERKYQCPYCDERKEKLKLISHIEKKHPECIPEGYTPTRIVFNIINKKEKGKCTICGKESPWNENKGRYDRFCSEKCKKQYEALAAERLKRVRGMTKQEMLKDPEYQNNVMLANRGISGKYKFQDGTIRTYVGSYERKFLEFMDTFLNVKSEDLETPGPIIEYKYNGETHKWITDAYYAPYNLVFDIKDGGDNPNRRNMPEYRAKQDAKEAAIKKQGKYNYLRLTDNKFEQLIELMMELKELYIENNGEYTPIVRINESVEEDSNSLNESYIIDKIYKGDNNMIHENKSNKISYSKDFKDVQKIVSNLSAKDKSLICNGEFKKSPYTKYREVILENNIPVSFIEVYELPSNPRIGYVVIATDSKYRHNGYSKILVSRFLKSKEANQLKRVVWKYHSGNDISLNFGKSMGFKNGEDGILYYNINESKYTLDKLNNTIHENNTESTLEELLSLNMKLNLFEYGLPVNGQITDVKSSKYWDENYKTMSTSEFERYKGGICWDYVFYQDYILKKLGIQHTNYYIISSNYQTHTITVAKDSGKLYYIESSFKRICGVYPADNINDILFFVIKKMGIPDYYVFKINSFPKTHSTSNEYMQFMEDKGTLIMKGKSNSIKDVELDNIQKSFKFPKDERNIKEFSIITPSSDKPSQEGFMGRGSWNPIKRVNGEPYRERVECVIFNKQLNKILISVDQKGVRIPGGGTMKDKSLESQVIKECQEEVRINIDNIKYIGEYYIPGKMVSQDDVYKGKYTYAYLATYDSDYEGYIRPEDESSMIKYIKWYDIYEAKSLLKQYNPDIYILFCNEYKEYIENLRLL